jgi:GAF domain-containing protein
MTDPEPDRRTGQLADGFDPVEFREAEFKERVDQLVNLARQVLGVAGAGLMLCCGHDRLGLIGASNDSARALERAQLQAGCGPSLQSTRTDQIVTVEDLAVDSRWPQVSERLRGLEVRGVLSVPIAIDERATANLNFFDTEPRAWTETDLGRARALATVAAAWLRVAVDAHKRGRLVARLQQTMGIIDPANSAAERS